METRWKRFKDKHKGQAAVLLGGYSLFAVIMLTFGIPHFMYPFAWVLCAIGPALMIGWFLIFVIGTVRDISSEVERIWR